MNSPLAWLATTCLVLTGTGCADSPATARTDLRAYLERTRNWAPVEAETNRAIGRILRTHFVDETEVLRQIRDSRPRVLAHLAQVRGVTPRSAGLARVHADYVRAWEELLRGYTAIEDGFASGNQAKLARGRGALDGWRDAIEGVARELRRLAEHLGLETGPAVETRASGAARQRT